MKLLKAIVRELFYMLIMPACIRFSEFHRPPWVRGDRP